MSELLSQHEAWKAVRGRLGVPAPPRARVRRHPLWIPPPAPEVIDLAAPYDAYVEPPPPPPVLPDAFRWRTILREVAAKHGFGVDEVCGPLRFRAVTAARHEAMYRMRHETDMSLPEIGRRLGGRDHSTVNNGIQKHIERMADGVAK